MLRSVKEVCAFAVRAIDGDAGRVQDFYFDDDTWAIRYLVVRTGDWLWGRRVLLRPAVLGTTDVSARMLRVALTRRQVHDGPDADTDWPVSRQREEERYRHYLWMPYWDAPGVGMGMPLAAPLCSSALEEQQAEPGDPHLRSTREVIGYHLEALDGEAGRVADFLLDGAAWTIRYAVVETGGWWSSRELPLMPDHIRKVRWSSRRIHVDLTRHQIEQL